MITDFSGYTNAGLRNITYNGVNSLADLGILITKDTTNVSELTVRSVEDDVPFRDGNIDQSRINGKLYYEPRPLVYKFKVFADSADELSEKEARIFEWLDSDGDFRIYDSNYSTWAFEKCMLKSIRTEPGQIPGAFFEYITASFKAYPYRVRGGSNALILKAAAQNSFNAVFFDRSRYYIASDVSHPAAGVYSPRYTKKLSVTIAGDAFASDGSCYFYIDGFPDVNGSRIQLPCRPIRTRGSTKSTLFTSIYDRSDERKRWYYGTMTVKTGDVVDFYFYDPYNEISDPMTLYLSGTRDTVQITPEVVHPKEDIYAVVVRVPSNVGDTDRPVRYHIGGIPLKYVSLLSTTKNAGEPLDYTVISNQETPGTTGFMYVKSGDVVTFNWQVQEEGKHAFDPEIITVTLNPPGGLAVTVSQPEKFLNYVPLSVGTAIGTYSTTAWYYMPMIPENAEMAANPRRISAGGATDLVYTPRNSNSGQMTVRGGDTVEFIYFFDEQMPLPSAYLGTVSGTFAAGSEQHYKIDGYAADITAAKYNGSDLDISDFTLDETVLIQISTNGFAYYEMWGMNTEERL